MTRLVRNYNPDCTNDDVIGCVFDWFEVRVKAVPDECILMKYGYNKELDKGCATHNHYFETSDFSLAWDIRSSYINKVWSHFRVKNIRFYSLVGYNALIDYVKVNCRQIFGCGDDDIIVSRIDFAYDMLTGSFWHNLLRDKFEKRQFDNVDKYTEFHGKIGSRTFTNYSCGSRSSQLFMRLYYKTIENTDYRDSVPKKQYIYDWHKKLFGVGVDVVRFEVEFKPQGNLIMTDLLYSRFKDFWEKFVCGVDVTLVLCDAYERQEPKFTEKDRVQLVKLLRKFLSSDWDINYSFADYEDTLQEFTDIIENVFNERL